MQAYARSKRANGGDARKISRRRCQEKIMHKLIVIFALAALAGCGVETATTAATGAAIKKQEVEEGKKTMEQARQKVGQAMEQVQQRAEKDAEKN
jgi:polyhydroxyalkanoate synthesis regulator phasin